MKFDLEKIWDYIQKEKTDFERQYETGVMAESRLRQYNQLLVIEEVFKAGIVEDEKQS